MGTVLEDFPYQCFHLPNVQQLSLGPFDDIVDLAGVKWNSSSPLQKLELVGIGFLENLPNTNGNLKHLTYLDLSYCKLQGTLSHSFGNLTELSYLSLFSNYISGRIPQELLGLEHLTLLDIGQNNLDAPIPSSAYNNLKSLKVLSLQDNKLTTSSVSSFLSNLTQLETLILSYNPLYQIPRKLFELPLLQHIYLEHTQLHGSIPKSFSNLVNLQAVNLALNNFTGPIVDALSNFVNLKTVDLSSNSLGGTLDGKFLRNFSWMHKLDLSFNSLSLIKEDNTPLPVMSIDHLWLASSNIRDLDFLRSIEVGDELYLSNNNIHGEIPKWAWSSWSNVAALDLSNNSITHIGSKFPLQRLRFLNLSSNLLLGQLPLLPHSIQLLFVSNNQFHGEIKSSICELRVLLVADLSNNKFSGSLPHCIGMMELAVLNLQMNELQGIIPDTFSRENWSSLNLRGNHLEGEVPRSLINCSKLKALDLSENNLQGTIPNTFSVNRLKSQSLRGNHFDGKVPRSLINCSYLEVLDLSDNNLNDTFPIWLGDALPNLRIISLRSNKFYGPISSHHVSADAFSQLQIIDLSYNQLSGSLSARLFQGFSQMTRLNESNPNYFGETYSSIYYKGRNAQHYHYSMKIVLNGNVMRLDSILDVEASIDLSCNHFEGEIKYSIGSLVSIRQLNLSHNNLTGEIPSELENPSNLQSLDLSSNKLVGSIPDELAALGFLSVMNLSHNHLTWRIPSGSQLQTFENGSYIGNDGLCGPPLSRKCQSPLVGLPYEEGHQELFDGFTWQSVLAGYGVGMCVGL